MNDQRDVAVFRIFARRHVHGVEHRVRVGSVRQAGGGIRVQFVLRLGHHFDEHGVGIVKHDEFVHGRIHVFAKVAVQTSKNHVGHRKWRGEWMLRRRRSRSCGRPCCSGSGTASGRCRRSSRGRGRRSPRVNGTGASELFDLLEQVFARIRRGFLGRSGRGGSRFRRRRRRFQSFLLQQQQFKFPRHRLVYFRLFRRQRLQLKQQQQRHIRSQIQQ